MLASLFQLRCLEGWWPQGFEPKGGAEAKVFEWIAAEIQVLGANKHLTFEMKMNSIEYDHGGQRALIFQVCLFTVLKVRCKTLSGPGGVEWVKIMMMML